MRLFLAKNHVFSDLRLSRPTSQRKTKGQAPQEKGHGPKKKRHGKQYGRIPRNLALDHAGNSCTVETKFSNYGYTKSKAGANFSGPKISTARVFRRRPVRSSAIRCDPAYCLCFFLATERVPSEVRLPKPRRKRKATGHAPNEIEHRIKKNEPNNLSGRIPRSIKVQRAGPWYTKK